MVTVRGLVFLLVVGGAQVALAQPAQPTQPAQPIVTAPVKSAAAPLVGATEVTRFTTPTGFIDDVVFADDQRLGYVIADAASRAELHVVTLATKAEQIVDLAQATLHPVALSLVGPRAFVIGVTEEGRQIAALVELADKGKGKPAGTIVYRLGPANHITVITRDGKPRVAVHKATTSGTGTRHELELVEIETGRRISVARPVELDPADRSKALELKVNHWSDGMTRAYGIKSGEWDKKEDQRSPDAEATYDLLTGKFSDKHGIEDLFEQRRRFQALADAGNRIDFLRVSWDNTAIQVWRAGRPRAIELDRQLNTYDLKSIQGVVHPDGSAWIVLKTDPVNPDAVARQKADPEYLDIFRVDQGTKAVRKARVLATGVRHRFGVVGDKFWLLERNNGFERGGRSLALYSLQ